MNSLIMLIGLPASGKSYYARKLAEQYRAEIVASDAVRFLLYGDENVQEHNQEVFNEVHRLIKEALANGRNVIYDATNLSGKRRRAFLNTVDKDVNKIAMIIATDYEVCLRQNNQRFRHVPEEVIENMYKNFRMPRKSEGWDEIHYIPSIRNSYNLISIISPCVGFDQDNPHHSHTLFDHMVKAAEYAEKNSPRYGLKDREMAVVYIAALFHDIGKPIVKTYIKKNGEKDTCAHYYNHADVGAYIIACLLNSVPWEDTQDWITILKLIQYHMDTYSVPNFLNIVEKYEGKKFCDMLTLLHEGDVNEH